MKPIKGRKFSSHFTLWLFFILVFFSIGASTAIDKEFPEAKVKIALLYNFLRFVEWPDDHASNIHICVIGRNDEYSKALKSLGNQKLDDSNVVVREYYDLENIQKLNECKIIFLTGKASHRQKLVYNTIKNTRSLTVGETEGFIEHGGMINFIRHDNSVRFEINLDAVNDANLRITSKILRIADRIISSNIESNLID